MNDFNCHMRKHGGVLIFAWPDEHGFMFVNRWEEGKRLTVGVVYEPSNCRFINALTTLSLEHDSRWLYSRMFHDPSPALLGLE